MAASNDETGAKPTFIITCLFKPPRAPPRVEGVERR
jgi:hypothetical protein